MNLSIEKLIKILALLAASGLMGGNSDKITLALGLLQFIQGDVNYASLGEMIQKNTKGEDAAKVALAVNVLQILASDEA
jgi:hypothetical protein